MPPNGGVRRYWPIINRPFLKASFLYLLINFVINLPLPRIRPLKSIIYTSWIKNVSLIMVSSKFYTINYIAGLKHLVLIIAGKLPLAFNNVPLIKSRRYFQNYLRFARDIRAKPRNYLKTGWRNWTTLTIRS